MSSVTKYNGSCCRHNLWRSTISFFVWVGWVGVSSTLIELWVLDTYLEYLQDFEKRVNEDWHVVIESFAICIALLAHKHAIVNLTAYDCTLTHVKFHMETLLDTLPPHRWCRFILVAKCNGLYQVCFFHTINQTNEFFH
jgi:hypothetical protein